MKKIRKLIDKEILPILNLIGFETDILYINGGFIGLKEVYKLSYKHYKYNLFYNEKFYYILLEKENGNFSIYQNFLNKENYKEVINDFILFIKKKFKYELRKIKIDKLLN